jgi:uncharacterized protein
MKYFLLPIIAYAVWALFCFFGQRWILYPGRSIRVPAAPALPAGAERLSLRTSTGNVEAWYLPPKGKAAGKRPAVIMFHGNGEVIDFLEPEAEGFRLLGMAALLVEFPGYGRSGGNPTEKSITEAALAGYDLLAERREVDPDRIVVFGRSLGCGAAWAVADRRKVAALILQSPFTSVRAFARRFLVPPFLVLDVFDNLRAARRYQGPLLVFHGRHDEIIPFSQGEKIAAAAPRGTLVPLECGHNDCPPAPLEYWRTIGRFLRSNGII